MGVTIEILKRIYDNLDTQENELGALSFDIKNVIKRMKEAGGYKDSIADLEASLENISHSLSSIEASKRRLDLVIER